LSIIIIIIVVVVVVVVVCLDVSTRNTDLDIFF